jgi:prepilin signal peptidase PulO-like enzyme (type II secretory pathway)
LVGAVPGDVRVVLGVTAFAVPVVLAVLGAVVGWGVLVVVSVVVSAVLGVVVLVLAARHQRALQTGWQKRRRGLRLVQVNGVPQVAHSRVAVRVGL